MARMNSVAALTVFALALITAVAPAAAQEEEGRQAPKIEEKIFTIKYGDVAEIYRMVRSLNSPWGRTQADQSSSIIVVRDTAETLANIAQVISRMDVAPDNFSFTFFVFTAEKKASEQVDVVL